MHSLIIPEEHYEIFMDTKKPRVKVFARFRDKEISFYAALQRDKEGLIRITFSKQLQKQLAVFPNDYFKLQMYQDDSKYGVEMPQELEEVLKLDEEAMNIFESLSDGRKRSLIYTILRYKNSQTRIDKSLIIIKNLKKGIIDPKLWLKS